MASNKKRKTKCESKAETFLKKCEEKKTKQKPAKKVIKKRKRVPKKKKSVDMYAQFKSFIISKGYDTRNLREFELAVINSHLQAANAELKVLVHSLKQENTIVLE